MGKQAVGLLETRGLCCLVSGVDAALKAASVELTGPMKRIGSGLCNAVVTAHVIARPDEAVDKVIVSKKPAPKASPKAK